MRTSRLIPLALPAILTAVVAVGAGAQTTTSGKLPLEVGSGTVYGDLGPASADVKATALSALNRFGSQLHIDAARLQPETVRHSILGTHVRGRSFAHGLPIDGSAWLVSIVNGRVIQVEAHDVTLPVAPVRPVISSVSAVAAAVARVLATTNAAVAPKAERLLVADHGTLRDTWRVWTLAQHGAARVDVDAVTGKVRTVTDSAKHADGNATLYDPNPVVTLKDNTLRDPSLDADILGILPEQTNAKLNSALRLMPIKDVNQTLSYAGVLQGPWVNVVGSVPFTSLDMRFNRTDPRFTAAMSYAHIDRYQRYLQDVLGFTGQNGVNNESQLVLAPSQPQDNSFYQPGNDLINFGNGGVDDAEDAEVILHEYGHAMQDAQVPGWGDTEEGGAMGEAFGDFQSAAYFARTSGGFQDLCVADWDATSYSTTKPPCLRRMDSMKQYPKDLEKEVHADGEMWSSFLWRVRAALAKKTVQRSDLALKLVIASHELQTPETDFRHGVAALKSAARILGHKEWVPLITKAAAVNGMPNSL